FHSYIAFRVAPLLMTTFLFVEWQRRKLVGRSMKPLMILMAVWIITVFLVALPIGLYFLHHPHDFTGRASDVSIFSDPHPARVEVKVLLRTLGMFNVHGDKNWRHNFAGRPQLVGIVGVFFLTGVWLSVEQILRARWRASPEWLLLLWFAALLVPELLTV